jgi:hypothetical protein
VGVERDRALSFCPIEHRDACAHRFGSDRTKESAGQRWSATTGPSTTLLPRRLPSGWVTHVPAVVDTYELSGSLPTAAGVVLDWYRRGASLRVSSARASSAVDSGRARVGPRRAPRAGQARDARSRRRRADKRAAGPCRRTRQGLHWNSVMCRSGIPTAGVAHRRPGPRSRQGSPPVHVGAERQVRRSHVCRFPFGEPAGAPVGGAR